MQQELFLKHILQQSPNISQALEVLPNLSLPNWYLGGGCIAQTVWNFLSGFDPQHGIKDVDVVYFDTSDLSEKQETETELSVSKYLEGMPLKLDLKNEARVHLWYEHRFGKKIDQYVSTEHAISTWPTTASSIGITKTATGRLSIFAPFGLDDLFQMIVRPNKVLITQEIYESKVSRWVKEWPRLKVMPWDNNSC